MAEKVKKYATNQKLFSDNIDNTFVIKEEFLDNDYVDDKMCISQTTITEASKVLDYARDVQIKQHEISAVGAAKIPSSVICDNSIEDNVKREDGAFCAIDLKCEFDNGPLFCNRCQEISQDYCIKCEMLVHILNPNTPGNTYTGESDEIPKDILEVKEFFGRLGIFTLKVIPQDVKFGPFIGLDTSGCCWKLRRGRFVVDNDKSKFLNWMRHINPARSISERNLLAFQCENNVYYRTIREIQVDEELLVYFGEEYDESFYKDIEVNFIPTVEELRKEVFACTFCCLGFGLKAYLREHKAICPNKINGKFLVEELIQCPFCKIHLDKQEYIEYHMSLCPERNDRNCIPLKLDNQTIGRNRRTEYLKEFYYKCEMCEYISNQKSNLQKHIKTKHLKEFNYKCDMCEYKASYRAHLQKHINTKHLKEFKYKCEICDFKTNEKSNLEIHVKSKHLKEFNYNCEMCKYETNNRANLQIHVKTKHLKEFSYECEVCKYETNNKTNLQIHVKTKHLKEFNYECDICTYKTNNKAHLELHIKSTHLKEFNYKCEICNYETNSKTNLEIHIKSKHLKEFNYECEICEFKTNRKSHLEVHIKSKHLKEFKYKCEMCEFETNWKSHLDYHKKSKHLKKIRYN